LAVSKKLNSGIGNDADAFQRHQRAHHIRKFAGSLKGYRTSPRQIVSQFLEIHFAEFQVQIVLKQPFDTGRMRSGSTPGFRKLRLMMSCPQTMNVLTDDMEEGIASSGTAKCS